MELPSLSLRMVKRRVSSQMEQSKELRRMASKLLNLQMVRRIYFIQMESELENSQMVKFAKPIQMEEMRYFRNELSSVKYSC